MKIQIRQGMFETNSSSCHTISISVGENQIPEKINFVGGEFGWSREFHSDTHTKAQYLWQAIIDNIGRADVPTIEGKLRFYKDYLTKTLQAAGVKEVEFDEVKIVKCNYADGFYIDSDGYIDHGNELSGWIEDMLQPNRLIAFLFCDESFVCTGNDNDDAGEPADAAKGNIYNFYKSN